MLRGIIVLFFLALLQQTIQAQVDQTWRYYYPEFRDSSDNNLYFRLENNNFVKNNEYFSDYIEGYTLMGYTIQPSIMYYAGSRLRVKAGIHILQYCGVDDFTEVLPTFSIHTKLTNKLDLIMGGLQGDVHHRLIEPVFNPENQYSRPIENGFQFLYNSKKLWVDTWVDWEQFIFLGDDKPEKFTAGLSAEYQLNKPESFWKISIPAQMVATHLGGQISNYSESMQSLANLVTGVKFKHLIGDGFIKSIGASTYLATYHDLAGNSGWDFSSGSAIYPVAEVEYKYGTLMAGYWHAKDFLAPKGSSLFQSTSNYKPGYYNEYRNIVTTKINFTKTFMEQIKFSATVETYYDIPANQLEYSYGLNLIFTPNFFITKVKFD